jgi:predicted Zn-dependent protease
VKAANLKIRKKKKNKIYTMKRIMLLIVLATVLYSCNRVPITGRKQVSLLPNSEILSLSLTEYNAFLASNKVITTGSNATMVASVGNDVARAVETVLKAEGYSEMIGEFDWEIKLVDSPEPNAWCMPGGKIVVYTGILPYTKTEAGLAVVIGHEVAHAVAHHGNERISQQLLASTGFAALDIAMANKPEETRSLVLAAAGVGTQVGVLLPFSRTHESEADRLGLIFMAAAGYNPNEAVGFWQRMSANGGSIPEFLSTHPSDETRISDIQEKYLPEAMPYYKPAK